MRTALLLLLILGLTGCAFREAMQRGQAASERGDWASAAAAYEAALREDTEDPRAAEALADVRRRWQVEALVRFEGALVAGDHRAATLALQQATEAQPNHPGTEDAARRLRGATEAREAAALRVDSEKASKNGDLRGAIRFIAQAERIHSTADGRAQWAHARSAVVEAAAAEERAGHDRVGLGLHETLAGVEAAHQPEVQAFRQRWAARERRSGEAALAAGHIGPAFLYFAQAAALVAQPGDAAQRDRLRADILASAALAVEVHFEGDRARAGRLGADGPGVAPGSGPPMEVYLAAPPITCHQTRQTRVAEGTYVAGLRDEPNPEWRRGRDAIEGLRAELRRLEADEERARSELCTVEEGMERDRRARRAERERDRERASRTLETARAQERRHYDALRSAQDRRDEGAIRQCETDVNRARQEVEAAWQVVTSLDGESPQGGDEPARERHDRAEREVRHQRERVGDAERALDRVPPIHQVPRVATHRYGVDHWVRSCRGTAQVRVTTEGPGFDGDLVADAHTDDRAHAAQIPLGLDEDLLNFPRDDGALAAEVDHNLGQQLAKVLKLQHKMWAQTLGGRAVALKGTPESLRLAAAALLLDREGASADLKSLLMQSHDIADFGILWAQGP